jgi:hypothetical protein
LIALGLAIAAVAVWWVWIRPAGPIGAADDPGKVLVVGDELAARAGQTVGDLGFSVSSMTLEQVEAKATETGQDVTGTAAALRWADHEGIGYVAFADPNGLDFSGITIADASTIIEPHHRFAVFSTGELGMPHLVTVGASAEMLIDVPAWVELMRALFQQERPASTLFPESQLPANAIKLHDQIHAAIELQGGYNAMEAKAKRLARERRERLVDAESAEPKPTILAGPLEETRAIALADGGVLLLVRPRVVEGEHDPSVELVQLPSRQIWYHPSGKWMIEDRVRCDSLRGGVLPDTRARYVVDDTGHVIAFDIGDSWDVWVLDAKPGTCAFSRAGSIPERAQDEIGESFSPAGRVVRSVSEGDDHFALRVHDPKGEAKKRALSALENSPAPSARLSTIDIEARRNWSASSPCPVGSARMMVCARATTSIAAV